MPASNDLTRGPASILPQGGSGTWDEGKIGPLSVIKMGAADYRMWYEGVNLAFTVAAVGYATSTDGTTWTKYASNPVMSPSVGWEVNEVAPGTVIWDGTAGLFKMWFHGGGPGGATRDIGYATSSDGLTWTKNAGNPIFTQGTGGQWDDFTVHDACVVKVGNGDYRMWYLGRQSGTDQAIGLATSSDGISWTRDVSNPVLQSGAGGQWDDGPIYGLWVMRGLPGATFHGWYAAHKADFSDSGIGYVSSPDGINWTRAANNPVLTSQAPGPPQEEISDPIFAYLDNGGNKLKVLYYFDDFGASPVERTHSEAFTLGLNDVPVSLIRRVF
jgi:hypothetical protein